MMLWRILSRAACAKRGALLAAALVSLPAAARESTDWTAAWATAVFEPTGDQVIDPYVLADATMRQVVRVSAGGEAVRLRLSNAAGREPLVIADVSIARSADNASPRILPGTVLPVLFGGLPGVTIPPGADMWSDPVAMPLVAGEDLAISLYVPRMPAQASGHAGSRATSHFAQGNQVAASDMPEAAAAPRWLFIAALEVTGAPGRAVAVLGDSITDGFGVQPDTNLRWTDHLAQRLRGREPQVAVINAGIGGNRLLLDGIAPNALARLERDVLSLSGVTHLIVLEGVNDLGVLTRDGPATPAAHAELVRHMILALQQIADRARNRGITVIGGTILPFAASGYYHPPPETEADRQAVNAWIRSGGAFDAVIDFDAAMRDPADPSRLAPQYDSGDGLHPSLEGYRAMAELVDLSLID